MNKSIRNLLVIFVIVVGIYFLFFRESEKITTGKGEEKLFEADSAKINKIEIIKRDVIITLEKIGPNWMVTQPVNYPTDTNSITPLLSNLQNFLVDRIPISTNPAKYSTYIDSMNQVTIKVYQEGRELGSFLLCKSGPGGNNSYIQKEEGGNIFLAEKLNFHHFTKPLKDYRNKLIFSIQSFLINKITFKSFDTLKYEFTLVKDTLGKWFIGQDSIPQGNIDGFLNLLANFNTEDFRDTPIMDFPPPLYIIDIEGQKPTTINVFSIQDTIPRRYVLQVSGINQLFECSDSYASMFLKKRKDFIPDKVLETQTNAGDTKENKKKKKK